MNDCPTHPSETKKPGYTIGCWGPAATRFAEAPPTGLRVALISDPSQDLHDRYGRALIYLDKADGGGYSVETVRAGAAKSYFYHGKPAMQRQPITATERDAIAAQSDLWGPPCYGNTGSVPN